jgi:hypothetical protein
MGIYFTYNPTQMHYNPMPFEQFYAYPYAHHTECYLSAAESALELPPGVILAGYYLPAGTLQLGSLPAGLSVAYWPPMDGWNPGYNLLCTIGHGAHPGLLPAGELPVHVHGPGLDLLPGSPGQQKAAGENPLPLCLIAHAAPGAGAITVAAVCPP